MKRKQSQPVRLVLAEQSSRSWQCSWLASSTSITDEVTDSQPVVKRQKLIGRKGANDPLSLIKKSANSTVKLHWLPTVEDGDHQAALATVLVDEILPASNSPLTRAELMPMLIKNSTADTVHDELVDSGLEACLLFSCEQVFLHVRLSSRSHSNQSSREAVYLLSDQSGKLGCLNCPSKLCLTARQQNLLDCLTDLASSGKTSLSKPLIIVACLRVERLLAASSSSRHRLGDDPADWPTSRGVWCRRLAHLVQLDWGLTDRSVQPVPASSGRENLMLFFDQVMDNNLGRSGSSEALISWYHTQSELVAMDKLGMHSQLRPYQRMALAWAARRELEPQLATGIVGGLLREAYREIQLPTAKAAYATKDPTVMSSSTSTTAVYYSPYHNHFVLRLPAWEKHSTEELGANSIARGGILADEMGLGKTVEMIALILAHPPPSPPANEDCTNIIDREDAEQLESKSPIGRQLYCLCNNAEVIGMNYGRRQRTNPIILLDYVVCDSCGDVQHRRCVGLAASSNLRRQSERGYLCPVCLLRQPPVPGRATLFVVPPILLEQVKLEFVRHTARPDFNLTVYSGIEHGYVQPMDLAQSDVVVTTYGVLQRESRFVLTDLIDEKHQRQRRYNRSARYPGHISPLTCVHWWRIVLDEAQTICSSNTQLAGMTNRLSAVNRWCVTGTPVQTGLSDLHGLFQFLGAPVAQCSRWFKHLLLYPYQAGSYQPLVEFTASLLWRQTKSRVADQIGIPPLTERVYRLSFSGIESLYYRLRMESERSAWRRTLDSLIQKTRISLKEEHRRWLMAVNGLAAIAFNVDNCPTTAAQLYREALDSIAYHCEFVKTDSAQELHAIHWLHEVLELDKAKQLPR
uniref:Helicase ATP-binding domain-containing protein n=1 Tax=Macrostomum lignano TaxID=282301 RepID=A0A1I8JEN0_9PLAT